MARSRVRVTGTKELKAAIRRAPLALQEEALDEVKASTDRMWYDARDRLATAAKYAELHHGGAGMQNITGAFRRRYRRSVSKTQLKGRVGLLSSTSIRRTPQVRWFNDGTANQPARPFHDDAFEAEEGDYITNQTQALRRVLNKVFR